MVGLAQQNSLVLGQHFLFLHKMLAVWLAKCTVAKPNTCCWLAWWFDRTRWVAVATLRSQCSSFPGRCSSCFSSFSPCNVTDRLDWWSAMWRFQGVKTYLWSGVLAWPHCDLICCSEQPTIRTFAASKQANKQRNIHRLRRGGIFDNEISRSRFQLHCGCFCIAHEFAAELGLGVNAVEQLWSNRIPNRRDLVWKLNSETAGRRRRRGRRKWWRIRNTIKCWV